MPPSIFLHRLLRILIAVCLVCAQTIVAAVAAHYEHRTCETAVFEWSNKEKSTRLKELNSLQPKERKLEELLFFLHIPRTGGRAYHQCFLKNLFVPNDRCPRSYDKLRLDLSKPSCKLLSTHDDMSILHKVESGRTSIVTNLRNPLDRVLSMYEFSVEVAARFLRLKTSNATRRIVPHAKSPSQLVSTLSIWPWKYLVPFMQRDIFARHDARLQGKSDWPYSSNTTYDAITISMPLREFIHHPVAYDLVHNGATLQVAGLTNNSFVEGADVIRKCIVQYPELGFQVLDVAKARLDAMLYVGLTEKHQKSATNFLHLVGNQIDLQSEVLNEIVGKNISDPVQEQDPFKVLMAAYDSCVGSLRNSHSARRAAAMQLIRPIKFSKEERKLIASVTVDEILSLNSLDVELYKHAEKLYAKQEKFLLSTMQPQDKDDLEVLSWLLFFICLGVGMFLFAVVISLRYRVRIGKDLTPLWLRRLLLMPMHEKL